MNYLSVIILTLSLLFPFSKANSQISGGKMSYKTYSELKASGSLPEMTNIEVIYPKPNTKGKDISTGQSYKTPSSCFGYTPPGIGSTPSLAGTDDGSIGPISLPFDFCFYGVNYNAFYLNGNGNITFGIFYSAFSASGFPSSTVPPMIAPFWGDVDFGASGQCYYEVFPDAVIIHWDAAGYYFSASDKLNTFELIITDGASPLLSPGNNVGFFYEDMQWTTGDASGGTNGFGGIPATVGINKGDGISFIQIGRFDQPGDAYDGAFGASDGVDWLDNKSLMFNVCSSTNIPPIPAGIDVCDTLYLCVGDTLPINFSVLSGEPNQTTQIVIDSSYISNYTLVSNTIGNTAEVISYVAGNLSNLGVDTLSIMAFDNGSPADTIRFELLILVSEAPFSPGITGFTDVCYGETTTLTATPGFDSYLWSDGSVVDNINVGPGSYSVTTSILGCTETAVHVVNQYPRYDPGILAPDSVICVTGYPLLDIVTLYLDTIMHLPQVYSSVLWSPGGEVTYNVDVPVGTYSVTTVDTNGCSATSAIQNVYDFASGVAISGPSVYCQGDSVLLDAGPGFDSYLWNTGDPADTLQTIYVFSGTYSVFVTEASCSTPSPPFTVTEVPEQIPLVSGSETYCFGQGPVILSESLGFSFASYQWLSGGVPMPGATTSTNSVLAGTYQIVGNYNICSDTSTVFTVIEFSRPPTGLQFNEYVCSEDSILVTASSIFLDYSWSNGVSGNPIYINQGGTYTLTYEDVNNCFYDSTIIITDVISPFLIGDAMTCDGSYQFTSNFAPQGVVWSYTGPGTLNFSSVNDINPSITTSTNGVYILTMTDDKCMHSLSHQIDFEGNPQANLLDKEICENDDYLLDATQDLTIVDYSWNTGVTTPTMLVEITGQYTVEIIGYCDVIQDSAFIDIVNCEIPNVITPNGDGQNETFYTRTAVLFDDVQLLIYNRWGRLVYKTDSYDNTWNSVDMQGNKLSSGTYFYIMKWDGGQQNASGTVTVFDSK